MSERQQHSRCIACDRTAEQVPLIPFAYILIHDPKLLTGKLPGAEGMDPAEHRD
jgi:hypothetical protein